MKRPKRGLARGNRRPMTRGPRTQAFLPVGPDDTNVCGRLAAQGAPECGAPATYSTQMGDDCTLYLCTEHTIEPLSCPATAWRSYSNERGPLVAETAGGNTHTLRSRALAPR